MKALAETSLQMQRCHCVRASKFQVFEYRGPQCLPHRDDVSRLVFEPQEEVEKTNRGVEIDDAFPALQCSNPSCQKWRRVDASTRDVFSNKRWWFDKVLAEERDLLVECVNLDSVIRAWLDALPPVSYTHLTLPTKA